MSPARRLLPLLGATGVVVLLHQSGDAATALSGADLHLAAGRLQVVATMGTRAAALMTADILLICSAVALSHRPAIRILAILHFVVSGLALLALPLFVADAGTLANTVGGGAVLTYRFLVMRILVFLLAGGLAGLIVGSQLIGISHELSARRAPIADDH